MVGCSTHAKLGLVAVILWTCVQLNCPVIEYFLPMHCRNAAVSEGSATINMMRIYFF